MAKLTESHLRKIIKEELSKVLGLNEGYKPHGELSKVLAIFKKRGLESDAAQVEDFIKKNGDIHARYYRQGDKKLAVETDLDNSHCYYEGDTPSVKIKVYGIK